ncbi:MAG: prepilin-type N-terminal cleavage/methylation domain-containing protein [Gammaproteobacteria bacterium]|nr:MAG: prepilin-type N-terminal cleavage/methylation domain-containing protein [Gammaproteobacteria bacterium]
MNYLNKKKAEKGFTLIELMIVVAIIGILAAIAIPQFASYRVKAFNSSAESDLRNIMTAEEAAYTDNGTYVSLTAIAGPQSSLTSLPGAKLGDKVCAKVSSASSTAYTAQTEHKLGNKTYTGANTGTISDTTKTEGNYSLGC